MSRALARKYIAEDIEVHQQYVAWLRSNPKEARKREPVVQSVGDIKHHRKWIRRLKIIQKELDRV